VLIVLRHAARQMPSWLIFDVGQNLSILGHAVAFQSSLPALSRFSGWSRRLSFVRVEELRRLPEFR
jgi:hypothetical protein